MSGARDPEQLVIRRLADGLVLRHGSRGDAEPMAAFQAAMHSDAGPDEPDPQIWSWTHDLLARPHPTFSPRDFLLFEDARRRAIVSALCTIPQAWAYEGVPLRVGRIELVATDPAHRRRRLVAALMAMAHQLASTRGDDLQVITGIPWYYRQFGYEMALELEDGRRGYAATMPRDRPGGPLPVRLRAAREDDLGALASIYDASAGRHVLHCTRTPGEWRYELEGRGAESAMREEITVLEDVQGDRVLGFCLHAGRLFGGGLFVHGLEIDAAANYVDVGPAVLSHLAETGRAYAARDGGTWQALNLQLGTQHPCYAPLRGALPERLPSYAWYVRVADVPALLRKIGPALERRLAASEYSGWSGTLSLGWYRGGVRLGFEGGRLADCRAWRPDEGNRGDVAFPDLTFLQLLFGFRSLEQLARAFPDCMARKPWASALVDALFPTRPSHVWPLA